MYYVYMLRCMDNSIYTGITTDVEKRMNDHFSKNENCAKYTLSHNAKKLEAVWETDCRKNASKLEYGIKKKLNKKEKELLIQNLISLNKFMGEDSLLYGRKKLDSLWKKN